MESNDSEASYDNSSGAKRKLSVKVCLWEFGQNDPKRDSGSKMCRFGVAKKLKLGQSFPGIVLSSESRICASAADRDIVKKAGIAGINCSWNRLDEIPFRKMGNGKNQRILPLLVAANSVNYGKPHKLNTAEATAACLYITGFKEDAASLLSLFSFGDEFMKLNMDALEAYSACSSDDEVKRVSDEYQSTIDEERMVKAQRKEEQQLLHQSRNKGSMKDMPSGGQLGGYMDDMDLPPMSDDECEGPGDNCEGDTS